MVLEADPDTEVSSLARSVLDTVHSRMMAMVGAGERKGSSSGLRYHSQADVTSTSLPGIGHTSNMRDSHEYIL